VLRKRKRPAAIAAAVAASTALAFAGPAQAATPSWHGGDPEHIKVLTAALDTMTKNYATLSRSALGPQDVFDYNIEEIADLTGGYDAWKSAELQKTEPAL